MKYVIPTLLVILYMLGINFPVNTGCPIQNRILYAFSHASVLHLATNILGYYFVIRYVNLRWFLLPFVVISAIIASLGAYEPTVGFSGVLWALSGMLMSKSRAKLKAFIPVFIVTAVTAFIPHMAWGVHAMGFAFGYILQTAINYPLFIDSKEA